MAAMPKPGAPDTLREGQVLSVGYTTKNVRGYLAVAGGFDLAPELGSLSVHVRSGIGPLEGAAIKNGATIPLKFGRALPTPEQIFEQSALPEVSAVLRVILGPQDQYFNADDLARFSQEPFTLTAKCDRMGYQLGGPKFDYRRDLPLISEEIALGSIQVLGDGLFIVALVDRQTVGGYPKIATVISPDIRALAQMRPGTAVKFRPIDLAEAQIVSGNYERFIHSLDDYIHPPSQELSSEALARDQFDLWRLFRLSEITRIMMSALYHLTISEAGRLIAAHKLSPVELVDALLARINSVDEDLHSYITVVAEEARVTARVAEKEIMAGRHRGPLHGIPYGLKDNFNTKGIRTTAASRLMLDFVPDEDATLHARLRSAGAILLGKLNTWEFGTGTGVVQADLPFPLARNPWDNTRFSGGSSTGPGVAVAAGTAIAALGSDTGGSVRIPAAACGLVGFKPTYGRPQPRWHSPEFVFT